MSAGEQARAAELRAAWHYCAEFMASHAASGVHPNVAVRWAETEAARRYPDPAEPRVVDDVDGFQWRYLTPDEGSAIGAFEIRPGPAQSWRTPAKQPVEGVMVRLWADLMAFPFERNGVKQATA